MVFVDDEIAHRQIGVALQLFAVRGQLPLPLAPAEAGLHHLRVRQHDALRQRILKAAGERSHRNGALAGPDVVGEVADQPGRNAAVGKEFLQRSGAAGVPGQNDDGVVRRGVVADVVAGSLEVAAVGGKLLGRDRDDGPGLRHAAALGEVVAHGHRELGQALRGRLPGQPEFRPGARKRAAAQKDLQILGEQLLLIVGQLRDLRRLVEEDERVGRKVVQRAMEIGKDQMQIAVRRGQFAGFPQAFRVGTQRRGELCPLGAAGAGSLRGLRLQHGRQPLRAARRQLRQRLRGGKNAAVGNVFGAALVRHVEKAHGVDLIAPEFHADRDVGRGGEDVENAAAAGVLSDALHLLPADVTAVQQRPLHLGRVDLLPLRQRKGGRQQRARGQRPLQQRGHGADDDVRGAARQRIQRGNALLLRAAAGAVRDVKAEVPACEQHRGLAEQGLQVPAHGVRRGVVRADRHQRQLHLLAERSRHVGAGGGADAADEHGALTGVQRPQNGRGFTCPEWFDHK